MDALDEIQCYFMHCHHYAEIPPDDSRFASTWVDMPNSVFDPARGSESASPGTMTSGRRTPSPHRY